MRLMIALLLPLFACGDKESDTSAEEVEEAVEEESEDTSAEEQ